MPVTNTGVINSPRSQNLCNTWNVCISIPFISGTSRRNSLSSYSHPNRVTSWPEAWDKAVGLAPQLLHPTGTPTIQAQSASSSWGRTQPTFGQASSTTELRVDTNGHHHQGWTLVYQKLVATPMCSTKTTHGNIHSRCSHIWCAAQTYPSQMQRAELLLAPTKESYVKKVSGTWHCDTLLSLLSVLSEHRGASGTAGDPTAANAAPAWKPHRLADRHISHSREEKEKQAVKEGGEKKVQLKARSPIDSQWTTCQSIKPCASHAFWVQANKTFPESSKGCNNVTGSAFSSRVCSAQSQSQQEKLWF